MIIEIAGVGYPVHGWWFILIPVAILALVGEQIRDVLAEHFPTVLEAWENRDAER